MLLRSSPGGSAFASVTPRVSAGSGFICQSCLEILRGGQKCDELSWCYTKVELDGERDRSCWTHVIWVQFQNFSAKPERRQSSQMLEKSHQSYESHQIFNQLWIRWEGKRSVFMKSPLPLWHLSRATGDVGGATGDALPSVMLLLWAVTFYSGHQRLTAVFTAVKVLLPHWKYSTTRKSPKLILLLW